MGCPKTDVESGREYALPESEFQLRDNLAYRRFTVSCGLQVSLHAVSMLGIWKRPLEGLVPWPSVSVDTLQDLGDSVSEDYFADMQGKQQRGRYLAVPSIQLECSAQREWQGTAVVIQAFKLFVGANPAVGQAVFDVGFHVLKFDDAVTSSYHEFTSSGPRGRKPPPRDIRCV